MKPEIAISYYILGKLSSDQIVRLADQWLSDGVINDSIIDLAMDRNPIMSEVGPLFEAAIKELGVIVPSRVDSAKKITRYIIENMISGKIDLEEGANFLYWDIHHEIIDELPDTKYVGSNLGLENIFAWLREIWDCRDGSRILYYNDIPREKAEIKFLAHLKEESEAWLINEA